MDLIKKLKLNPEQPLWLINAPGSCMDLFDSFEIKTTPESGDTGQVALFVTSADELTLRFTQIEPHISTGALLWIFYPKKSGSIGSDLAHMKNWDIIGQLGFRGQTSVSVNEDWSGFRVTREPKKAATISDLPMEDRKVEGIDFVNRTVHLPADALAIVNQYKGMADFFNSMSFTHKKEYVMAIVDARQEATRKRRIGKMVEMLQQKMELKALQNRKKEK